MQIELDYQPANPVNAQTCATLGKDCRSCVNSTASVVALLCPSMDLQSVQQMFFRLYQQPGCAGMARAFLRDYLSATDSSGLALDLPEPKPVRSAGPFYQIAAYA
jgi:hypothetical protein